MGYNPYRKFVPKRADYLYIVAVVVVGIALVAWAFLG